MGKSNPARDLWVPMRTTETQGSPRARASQVLEMLIQYGLVADAQIDGDGFTVTDNHGKRHLTGEQVLDEYGERIARMVEGVAEHSPLTTTKVSVTVSPPGPVPYLPDVGDRMTEYPQYWPK